MLAAGLVQELAVKCEALEKRYGDVVAVAGLTLHVKRGECFGLLGPNGAGKTTTMKMLATLLIPTSGTIRVLGIDPLQQPRQVRARLGAMLSGERSLYWKLTARENLEYFAALYHVPPAETKTRIANVLQFCS